MSPIFIFGAFVTVFFCGITLDIGRIELLKMSMQSAADAAAIGSQLEVERGTSTWVSFGKQEAVLAGYTDGANNTMVSIVQAPVSGSFLGRFDAVQVTITKTIQTIFMGILNGNTYTVTAQSSALVAPCNYFLGGSSPSYSYTLTESNTNFSATCPTYINNNFSMDSGSKLQGFGVTVSGTSGASMAGGTQSQSTQGPVAPPPQQTPTFNVRTITDPMSAYGQPAAFSSCGVTSYSVTSGSQTINPGTYCGTASTPGLTISNATVTMNPGLYTITGGIKWNNATVNGAGVTLFFTKGNGANYGQVLIGTTGPCNLNLTAPVNANNGTQSILFWADRAWVSTGSTDFQVAGAGTFTGDGIWYMPFTGLSISQMPVQFTNYGSFVVRNASFSGTTLSTGQNVANFNIGSLFRAQGGMVQ